MTTPTLLLATPEQIAALIREAVELAFSEQRLDVAPILLDRSGIARALGLGTSSIDRFRKAGMPAIWVGDAPRFLTDECLAWLRANTRKAVNDE
jgi:hypothetical protein